MNEKLIINDATLRDGSHALLHQLTSEQVELYCNKIDKSGVDIVEVGHGNGLGASSLQVGESLTPDRVLLQAARKSLKNSKLGVFVVPGFATIEKDLKPAIDIGADVFRIVSHCTEADTTEPHIKFCKKNGKTVFGVLLMCHMLEAEPLCQEALKMQDYGAEGIILMDSAGYSLPEDVKTKVSYLVENLSVPVGFHAHNNLGMAIANSLEAVKSGALIIDATARGFGAGAGNAQIEALAAVFQRRKEINSSLNLYELLDAADIAEKFIINSMPHTSSINIASGLAGVFSGFEKHVVRISEEFEVDPKDIFFELGKRKILAGQEDMIINVANDLAKDRQSKNDCFYITATG
ncbi:4-hydroxy-2-oxovalerate aldolase [Desulfobacter vibrioformis]|uniref:4-hydroxy-2-oxovalerate aldolase n=1 Tax=Desulfobacter vibrioformis TaxID=34031 RepID=UPI000552B6D7|nr:4-hydroxy-2-oxovalerate aldolase [Desulfobacter vibrioformis]